MLLLLVLKRTKSRPKKVYKDVSALQASYMRERDRIKMENSRRKFEERKARGYKTGKVEKTKAELAIENQQAFYKRIVEKLYRQRDRNKQNFFRFIKKGRLIRVAFLRKKSKRKIIFRIENNSKFVNFSRLKGYSHFVRGSWKIPLTARGEGQGKPHYIFGNMLYLKNVKERFWSFLYKNNQHRVNRILNISKLFIDRILLGKSKSLIYVSRFTTLLHWILHNTIYLRAIKSFFLNFNNLKTDFIDVIKKEKQYMLNQSKVILTPSFFLNNNQIDFDMFISKKKEIYILLLIKRLFFIVQFNNFPSIVSFPKNNDRGLRMRDMYSNFISNIMMLLRNNSNTSRINNIFDVVINTCQNQIFVNRKRLNIYETKIKNYKPILFFYYQPKGFDFINKIISGSPLKIDNLCKYVLNFKHINSTFFVENLINYYKYNNISILNKFNLSYIYSSNLFSYKNAQLMEVNANINQHPVMLFVDPLLLQFFNLKYTNILDFDNIVLFYSPVISDFLELPKYASSSVLKEFFLNLNALKTLNMANTYRSKSIKFQSFLQELSDNVSCITLMDFKKQYFDVSNWVDNFFLKLQLEYSKNYNDFRFPFLFPTEPMGSSLLMPNASDSYSGTRYKVSGKYTTSIREGYKKENTVIIKQLVRTITSGGGQTRSLSIIKNMLKRFKLLHDNYDISALTAVYRCVNFCSSRLRVKQFVKGTSKIYKFLPMRHARKVSTGIRNFVGASFLRSNFQKTHKKFHMFLSDELASVVIGMATKKWTPQERFSLKYVNGTQMDVSDETIPPTLDIVRNNRQMLIYLRYFPNKRKGRVLINSPYLEYISRKRSVKNAIADENKDENIIIDVKM